MSLEFSPSAVLAIGHFETHLSKWWFLVWFVVSIGLYFLQQWRKK